MGHEVADLGGDQFAARQIVDLRAGNDIVVGHPVATVEGAGDAVGIVGVHQALAVGGVGNKRLVGERRKDPQGDVAAR